MTDEEIKEALEKVMTSGVSSITIGDKTITYRSQADLERQLEKLNRKTRPAANLYANPSLDRGL